MAQRGHPNTGTSVTSRDLQTLYKEMFDLCPRLPL
jgi:hypothetical protein